MANGQQSSVRLTDGSTTFEGGIDSGRTPTIESNLNPNGLRRNQNAWLDNGTVRGGGISPRYGWVRRAKVVSQPALYQGGYMYEPDNAFPYLMLAISGHMIQVRVDTDFSVVDVTTPATLNDPTIDQHWMTQAEQFLVDQDNVAEPRIWDGVQLRRVSAMGGPAPFIPTGQAMDYFMGRLWIANGREYLAGDIVFGPSGTAPYGRRDAVLHVTENMYLAGGGVFIVPTVAGNIRAIAHTANLDTALGEGRLFVFTRKTIYAVNVTPKRSDWQSLSEPLQTVVQRQFGTTSDRSIVPVNGDLFFQSVDGVRSLLLAIRNFGQWGNTSISREENRVIGFNDKALQRFGFGVNFDNRLLQSVLPFPTPVGVGFKGLMPLDFDLLSNLGEQLPPVWEGMLEGLDHLQAFVGDFGGRERCFTVIHSRLTGDIEVWELTNFERFDEDGRRIEWYFETPAYTWGNSFTLKELDSAELWIDRLFGTVDFKVQFRVDQDPCWRDWVEWRECNARDSCEYEPNPICYPTQPFCESYRATASLPKPPRTCGQTGRPINIGYQFQLRIIIKGWARIRGLLVHALPVMKRPYENLVC